MGRRACQFTRQQPSRVWVANTTILALAILLAVTLVRQDSQARHFFRPHTLTYILSTAEHHLAKIYSAQHAFTVSSGMAALDVITRLLKPGDHVIAGDDLYGGTNRLLTYIKTHMGVIVHHIDTTDPTSVLPLVAAGKTAMVLLESPTNPLLKIADIEQIALDVHRAAPEALVVVDNTMMSPYLQRPLELGADIVYDSGTKYLSGHHDLMAGVVTCNREDVAKASGSSHRTIRSDFVESLTSLNRNSHSRSMQ